ncbi:MAG: hypothetical protein D6681_11995 [Calditrichaeota bacterium]|nr:MAG: hypothetical protein D6681_11995 [Calditrichota bacterium]
MLIYYATAIKEALGRYFPEVLYLPLLMALGIGLSLNNGRAAIEAVLGRHSEFVRTPKYRLEGKRGTWRRKLYKPGRSYQPVVEFLIASYFTYALGYFLSQEVYFSMPFFLLFLVGFYYIAISSFVGQKR